MSSGILRCLSIRSAVTLSVLSISLLGCDKTEQPPSQESPPKVSVVNVVPESVEIMSTLPGRLEPWRIAEVRAQVSGIVKKRYFTEGSEVKAGQKLFQIDPAPYRASLHRAESSLETARANLAKALANYERVTALDKVKAVSELDAITSKANYQQAKAEVKVAQAAVESARIQLDYATVVAPISGRIGRSMVTEGALVKAEESTHLATIQQLDPMYATFTQTVSEAVKLRRSLEAEELGVDLEQQALPVRVHLDNQQVYEYRGRLLFAEMSVDPATDNILFRAELPNPETNLLPGMYVRIELVQARYADAVLIPQAAVTRDKVRDTVMVVGEDNRVSVRDITVAGNKENFWIVTGGLHSGDQVMVDAFFKVFPGTEVEAQLAGSTGVQLAKVN